MLSLFMIIEDENIHNKLEELYLLYYKEMFYVAYSILKDYHEAEDVVQNTIIKLLSRLEKIETVRCNKTRDFLVIIVRNLSINIYKLRKQRKSIPIDDLIESLPKNDISPELHILRLEQAKNVAKLLAKLDDAYADILALKYSYEYSNSEIAELINTTEGNVRVKLHRARQALKKLVLEEDKKHKEYTSLLYTK